MCRQEAEEEESAEAGGEDGHHPSAYIAMQSPNYY